MLKKNVGTVDKILRIVMDLALLAGALAGYGAWMWIGLIPLSSRACLAPAHFIPCLVSALVR